MCRLRPSLLYAQLLCFLLIATVAGGQTRVYEIRFGNNLIGTIDAKQETTSSTRRISITSQVQMKILSRMEVDIFAEYRNNHLQEAKAIRQQGKNGADDKATVTLKTDKGYQITRKGEAIKLLTQPITYTVSDLYFIEPKDVKQAYSETLGEFAQLKVLPDKRYELAMSDGKKSLYRYEKGKLVEVEIQTPLGKAFFKFLHEK